LFYDFSFAAGLALAVYHSLSDGWGDYDLAFLVDLYVGGVE
jgi:hypothetical protein